MKGVLVKDLYIANLLLAFHIVLVISVIWFFISYRLAVKVYQKRDITSL